MAEPDRLSQLLDIARAIAREPDTARLIERILLAAKDATQADGGSVYLVEDAGRRLAFALLVNDTLGIRGGWAAGAPLSIEAPPLYEPGGAPNHASVVAHCVHSRRAVRLEDAYTAQGFDFAGARAFDAANRYRSRSFLTVPMIGQAGQVIGVLQLVNARAAGGVPAAFDAADEAFTEGLAGLAAIVLEKQRLIERLQSLDRPAGGATGGGTPSPPAGAA